MRIDVAEYITECRRISQYCQDRQTEITELKSALATFRSEMEEHFVGKTGTAIVSYLDEAIKPALEKTETLLTDEIETMNTMINDMLEYFEEDGIVDLDYINDEYLYHFNRFSDAVSENLDETNRITRSINHIIELPRLNVDFPQELKHAMRRTVDNVTNLVTDLDRHWQTMLDRIDEQIEELKTLLSRIDDNNISPMTYQTGTIQFLAMKKGDFKEVKTLDDFDSIEAYYRYVLAMAEAMGKINKFEIDGVTYYEINEIFAWQNYGGIPWGTIVFTDIDGELQMFMRRGDADGIAVPFGLFYPDPFQLLLKQGNFGVEFEENVDGVLVVSNIDNMPILYHIQSNENDIPIEIKNKMKNIKAITKYFGNEENSKKVGLAILKYLGYYESNGVQIEFTAEELDAIAGRWSGSKGRWNFTGEIEAHADLMLNADFIAWMSYVKEVGIDKRENYYEASAIADMAFYDTAPSKEIMDLIWGTAHENSEMREEKIRNLKINNNFSGAVLMLQGNIRTRKRTL